MSECKSYAVTPPLSTYLWATFCGTKLPYRFSSVSGNQNSQSIAVVVVIWRVLMSSSSKWVHRESSTCWYVYSKSSFKFTGLRQLLLLKSTPTRCSLNYDISDLLPVAAAVRRQLQSAGLCDAPAASPTSHAYVIVSRSGSDRVR